MIDHTQIWVANVMIMLFLKVTNICDAWEITEKDTMLHVLPLHHTHGLIHALISPLAVGARYISV